jgi:VanZ family protein
VLNAFKHIGLRGIRLFLLSVTFCIIYAISDEIHQTFVLGRSGEAIDVILDSVGASAGIVLRLLYNLNFKTILG